MRIFNDDDEKGIKGVTLILTTTEAEDLIGAIQDLIKLERVGNHVHIDDGDYQHEITVALFEPGDPIDQFKANFQKLILEDK